MIKFEKWQGLGNDFIILFEDIATSELAKKICNTHFGIGADGLICPTKSKKADIGWKFYNSDGSKAQMCGNGMRCFAKFCKKHKLTSNTKFKVETQKGIIICEILKNGSVVVDMGEPIFESNLIPVNSVNPNHIIVQGFKATALSMGNPHCVIFCEEDAQIQAKAYGKLIENDEIFPQKTNVEFVNVISPNKIKMHVWERGCGITLACGTGACASVVAGVKNLILNRKCLVELPGGNLEIEYCSNNHVLMQGSATLICSGRFNI